MSASLLALLAFSAFLSACASHAPKIDCEKGLSRINLLDSDFKPPARRVSPGSGKSSP